MRLNFRSPGIVLVLVFLVVVGVAMVVSAHAENLPTLGVFGLVVIGGSLFFLFDEIALAIFNGDNP